MMSAMRWIPSLLLLLAPTPVLSALASVERLQKQLNLARQAGDWKSALKLLDKIGAEGDGTSTVAYNNAAAACSRAGQWARALALLDSLMERGGCWDAHSFTTAITVLGKRRQWEAALSLLHEMRDPNVFTFGAAIGACAESAQWESALKLLDDMTKREMLPTARCYNGALAACDRARQPEAALTLFDRMRSSADPAAAPTEVSYGTLISAIARQPASWTSERASELLFEMLDDAIEPSPACYGAVALAHSANGEWQRAFDLLTMMEERRTKPNGVILCNVLNACAAPWCAPDACKPALALLRGMEQRYGLKPDLACVNTVIKACARGGEWKASLELLAGLGERANERSYVACLSGLGSSARWREALYVLDRMRSTTTSPNLRAYTATLTACAGAARWREALRLWNALLKQPSVRIDAVTVSKVVEACAQAGEWRAGLEILNELHAMQLQPTIARYPSEQGDKYVGANVGMAAKVDGSSAVVMTPRDLNAQLNRICILHDELRRIGTLDGTITLEAAIACCEKWGLGELLGRILERLREQSLRASTDGDAVDT